MCLRWFTILREQQFNRQMPSAYDEVKSKTEMPLQYFLHYCWLTLIDWLIMMRWDYVSEMRPLISLLFISRVWAWRAMVMVLMMMPAGYNSWLVHQSSQTVLPAEISGASRRNGRRSENFAYQYLKYLKGFLSCRKILRHGTFPLYFPSEGRCAVDFYRP
jgi:hypothetical protein